MKQLKAFYYINIDLSNIVDQSKVKMGTVGGNAPLKMEGCLKLGLL